MRAKSLLHYRENPLPNIDFSFACSKKHRTFANVNKMSNEFLGTHKFLIIMKTIFKSTMVIGMMLLGTMTSFGKTTTNVDKLCKHPVLRVENGRPVLDKKTRNHIIKGNHKYNKDGLCRKCKLTRSQIYRIERHIADENPTPLPAPPARSRR